MIHRLLSIALLAAGTLPASAQIVVQPEFGRHEPVEWSLQQRGDDVQVLWDVRPRDGKQEYTMRDYAGVQAMWAQPGRYAIEATVVIVDFDARTFELKRYRETIRIRDADGPLPPGPDPPDPDPPGPEPEPQPAVPEDRFDNLARRVDQVVRASNVQRDKLIELASVLDGVADRMESVQIKRISDAVAEISDAEKRLGMRKDYGVVREVYREDAVERAPMTWVDAIEWYRALAVGLRGGK
jgi:hypothetical protein